MKSVTHPLAEYNALRSAAESHMIRRSSFLPWQNCFVLFVSATWPC
jgi:hypothetical protein